MPSTHPKKALHLTLSFLFLFSSLLIHSPAASAKTYVITDGERTITRTVSDTNPIQEDPALTIRRALEVTLVLRGETSQIPSPGETVGELLTRLGVELTQGDTVSHPLEEPVTDGMTLRIDTTILRQETYTTTLPHDTTYCDDASVPQGTETVLIPGRDGELLCTAEVTYVNGQETSRQLLSATQTIAPITEIIAQGTAAPVEEEAIEMPVIEDGYILMPSGEVLTYYKTDNVTATGYTHTDAGCNRITATGTTVHYGTVAVDPRFIPYGTRMLIVSHDGQRYYGIATAEDCGGAIKRDKMDLYFPTYQECIDFGRRRCTIYFLG